MVNQELVNYIQNYHSKGYSISTLKDFLINEGYDLLEVEEAINTAYKPTVKKSKSFLILVIIASVVVVVALVFLVNSFLKETTILNVSVYSESSSVEKGSPFIFKVAIFNEGTKTNYDVLLSYNIINNGKVVDSFQERVNSETPELIYSTTVNDSGSYTVNVTISYFEFQEQASLAFRVTSICGDGVCSEGEICQQDCLEIVCGDGICSEGEDCEQDCLEVVCGDGICSEGEDCVEDCLCGNDVCDEGETSDNCLQDCPLPDYECGNGICEATETTSNCPDDCRIVTGINALSEYEITKYIPEKVAKDGTSEAASECDVLADLKKKDTCFYWIMRSSNSSFYCKFIENPAVKDDCYVSYAYETRDYTNCEVIVDRYKRETCELLARTYT